MHLRLRVCVKSISLRSTHCKAREAVEEEEWEEPEEEEEASSLVVRIGWRARKSIEDVDETCTEKSRFEPQDQEFMYLFQRCWKKFENRTFWARTTPTVLSEWTAHESLKPRCRCVRKRKKRKKSEGGLAGSILDVNGWYALVAATTGDLTNPRQIYCPPL